MRFYEKTLSCSPEVIFYACAVFSQSGFVHSPSKGTNPADREGNQIQNRLVLPPLGRVKKANTYYVGPGKCLFVGDSTILIVNKATGKTQKKLSLQHSDRKSYNILGNTEINFSTAKNKQDGWITWAECEVLNYPGKPITYLSAEWSVPNPPLEKSGQLIYLFVGLDGNLILPDSNDIYYILQPVLQWGMSPAGGGKYWSVCNWLVTNEGQYFHDSLIKVNPGDSLQGVVKRIAITDSTSLYNSSFTGYGEGLEVQNLNFWSRYFALETYGVRNCDDNPADEKMRMFNIKIMIDDSYLPLFWQAYNNIDHCGEFINIIHESSYDGEINIHFHKPDSKDNYDDIYIYPNPIRDILHLSITNPIFRCRIEIYNGLGILVLTETQEILEYEYDINLQNYPPGIYYAKFYYQKDKYTRETNHTLKFIKAN